VQFIAHVSSAIRFNSHNALLVQLLVPAEFVEDALDIRFMAGSPLSIEVQKWRIVPQRQTTRWLVEHPATTPEIADVAEGDSDA